MAFGLPHKHPERNSTAWKKACLSLLQQVHPDYRLNRDIKGHFIEFVRPDPSGLLVSQNFTRIKGVYYLCFALIFTTKKTGYLSSPLHAGSRFDHNLTIWQQFWEDLNLRRGDANYPSGLWSSGEWRSNTLGLLSRGLALNEQHLLPYYRRALTDGKSRLIELFEAANRLIPALEPNVDVRTQASRLGVDPDALDSFPFTSARMDAFLIAKGGHCYVGSGPESNTVDLGTIPPEVMALHYAERFQSDSSRLAEILRIAERL